MARMIGSTARRRRMEAELSTTMTMFRLTSLLVSSGSAERIWACLPARFTMKSSMVRLRIGLPSPSAAEISSLFVSRC